MKVRGGWKRLDANGGRTYPNADGSVFGSGYPLGVFLVPSYLRMLPI